MHPKRDGELVVTAELTFAVIASHDRETRMCQAVDEMKSILPGGFLRFTVLGAERHEEPLRPYMRAILDRLTGTELTGTEADQIIAMVESRVRR